MLRRIKYFNTHTDNSQDDQFYITKTLEGEGWFHQWVQTFGYTSQGNSYPMTLAIIEKDDGTIEEILPTLIQFIDQPENLTDQK